MANYFYFDQTNRKQGPVSKQQLKELAAQGIIGPQTPMETDAGHKGVAGQIPGLFVTVPPPFAQPFQTPQDFPTSEAMQAVRAHAQRATGTIFSWMFDFAFRDIRIHIVNLWAIRILYVLCWIGAILWGLWGTYMTFRATEMAGPLGILLIPIVWLGIAIQMFFLRLFLEWCLIILDWIVETTRAARLYIENNKKE